MVNIVVTSDVLVNQLRRDALRIAESFDELCDDDLQELSALYSEASAILVVAFRSLNSCTAVQAWAAEVLINVGGSISAAALVLRSGYTLVPGVVLRNSVEAMAVCLHGLQRPSDLEKIKSGTFNTPKAMNTAKQVLPPFGHLNGLLSNSFTHISPLHQEIKPLVPFKNRKESGLELNLAMLRIVVWVFYAVCEFAFINFVQDSTRYWKVKSKNEAQYCPSEQELDWMINFIEKDFGG
jgi:hypothetical protein